MSRELEQFDHLIDSLETARVYILAGANKGLPDAVADGWAKLLVQLVSFHKDCEDVRLLQKRKQV